jgi:SAM-dependent methyltransferase
VLPLRWLGHLKREKAAAAKSMPNPFVHPARLRALAVAYGNATPALGQFRYLDLACGLGGDLLPLAAQFPDCEFVGCDIPDAIEGGAAAARQCGLSNVRFVTRELLEGRFDFVVAHNLYASLPKEEQRRLLALVARSLSPRGVALVSYPTLPGASLRQLVRATLARAVRPEMSANEQVWGLRARLAKLERHLPGGASPSLEVLRGEFARIQAEAESRPAALLAPEPTPLHVAEVIGSAREHGLELLGDALAATEDGALELDVVPNLVAEGLTRVEAEEALDLLANRRFRATLLVKSGHATNPAPQYEALLPEARFAAQFELDPAALDLSPGVPMTFESARGALIQSEDAHVKAALVTLTEKWPHGLTGAELREAIVGQLELRDLANAETRAEVQLDAGIEAVLELVRRRHVELLPWSPSYSDELDYAPRLRKVTRLELSQGAFITSVRHEPVLLDELFQTLAALLDGSHQLADCIRVIGSRLDSGALTLPEFPSEPDLRARALQAIVLGGIVRLRNLGVLEPPLPNQPSDLDEEST